MFSKLIELQEHTADNLGVLGALSYDTIIPSARLFGKPEYITSFIISRITRKVIWAFSAEEQIRK